jgi:hypothetical protein
MLSPNDVLIHSLTGSQGLLNRLCEDLKPAEYLHRPCTGANCAAWVLGHLILTERNALKAVGLSDLPALPEGFEKRFSQKEDAPKATEFGDATILLPLFNRQRQLLIDKVKGMSPDELTKPVEKPHPMFSHVWSLVNLMGLHVMLHGGQVSSIRRSLGRPPVM